MHIANPANGTGPDIVLIHGTGSNAEMWRPQVELLTHHGYRCFLPDLRGHGQTNEPMEPADMSVHIQDLLETFAGSGISFPAVFVGHSLGAMLSLALAEQHPKMIARIFAASMPGRVPAPVSFGFELFLRMPYEKLRGTLIYRSLPWRQRTLLATSRFTLNEIVKNFKRLDHVSRPPRVLCPVHFSAGRFDPVAPWVRTKRLHEALPNSTFQIFEMGGHNFMDRQQRAFNDYLLQHLQENSYCPKSETANVV